MPFVRHVNILFFPDYLYSYHNPITYSLILQIGPYNEPFENLAKRILWAIFPDFDISKAQTPFLPKSGTFPPSDNTPRFITNTLRTLRTNLQSIKPVYSPTHHIPKSWIKAIKDLQSMINNRLIIIKPCDKGSSLVVLSTKAYLQEGYNQLNDPTYYKKL